LGEPPPPPAVPPAPHSHPPRNLATGIL